MKTESVNKNTQAESGYMGRNGRWLLPLSAAIWLLLVPMMVTKLAPEIALPNWIHTVSFAAAFLGVCLGGFLAYFTDTVSAKIACRAVLVLSVIAAFSSLIIWG